MWFGYHGVTLSVVLAIRAVAANATPEFRGVLVIWVAAAVLANINAASFVVFTELNRHDRDDVAPSFEKPPR